MARKSKATPDVGKTEEQFGSRINPPSDEKPVATAAQIAEAAHDIMVKQRAVSSAAGIVGAAFLSWEKAGVSKELIRETIRELNKDMSQAEAARHHAESTRYKIAVGLLPIADANWARAVKQADLGLDAVAAAGEIAENIRHARAFNQGHLAGKRGKSINVNPFSAMPGSIEFVGWRDGWEDGNRFRKLLKPEKAGTVQADDSRERVEPDDDDPIGATAGSA